MTVNTESLMRKLEAASTGIVKSVTVSPGGQPKCETERMVPLEEAIAIILQQEADQPRDIVERVAIAICPWFNGSKDGDDPRGLWDDMFDRYKEAYREQAKAAIMAMKRELVNDAIRTELAAHRAVFDAAKELNRLMAEVELDESGQNDRVFAHFEFDQLRYALGLVESLTGTATNDIEVPTTEQKER